MSYDDGNSYQDNAAEYERIDAEAEMRAAINARYQELLGRPVESEAVMRAHLRNPEGIQGVNRTIVVSDEYKNRSADIRANQAEPGTTPSPPAVSPISTSTDPTSATNLPRTATNPFGSDAVAPTDVGMSNMIEQDKAGWEAYLKANWPKGLAWDPGAIDGVIRQLRYAANGRGSAAGNAKTYIDQALAYATSRAQSGGDRSVSGNYDTNWNDADPARTSGRDPSAAYTTAMNNLQTQMDAERDPTKRNALQTKMAAMFNGAYVGPPPTVSTIGAITSSAPTVPTNPAAPAYSSQPTTAYSARQAVPTSAVPPVQASPVPAAMPVTTTMANMMTPQNPYAAQTPYASQNPYAAARQFGYANDVYDRSLQGTGFARAPWAGTRDQLARGPMAPSPIDPSTGMPSAGDRRRAYQFGAQDAANNQRDAMLGQQDFNGQMNNWLKAYNDWNRRGADPLAPLTGGA